MFGDLLATSLRRAACAGWSSTPACATSRRCARCDFPSGRGRSRAKGTVKATLGSVNVPVVCAGALVNPGDVIVADDDGVVVVPRREAARVAEAGARARGQRGGKRRRLAAGELGLDIYGMRDALAKAGLRYVDRLPSGE